MLIDLFSFVLGGGIGTIVGAMGGVIAIFVAATTEPKEKGRVE